MITREYQSTNFITGLRAIAILMVFLIHSGGGGIREMFSFGDRIIDMGKYGVDIFFVISGFTIFYQLYERKYSFKHFLIVRLIRISIPYFPLIFCIYIFAMLGGDIYNYWAIKFNNGEISIINLILHLFYISFIDIRYANTIIGVEWTLAIEVFYYFLLGYLIYKFKIMSSFKGTLYVFLFLFLVSIFTLFIGKQFSSENSNLFISWLPFKYGYMFIFGGVAFHIRSYIFEKYSDKKLKNISNIILISSMTIFVLFLTNTKIPNVGIINEFFFSFLTFMLIVFVDDNSKITRVLTNNFMIFIGSISFSFYLLHMLVLKSSILDIGITNNSLNFIYYLFLTVIISTIYYYLLEMNLYKKLKLIIKRKI